MKRTKRRTAELEKPAGPVVTRSGEYEIRLHPRKLSPAQRDEAAGRVARTLLDVLRD